MAAADLTTRSRNGSARKSSSSSSSSSSSEGSTSKLSSQKSNPLPSPQLRPRFSLLDVIRILGGVFLLSSALSYFVTSNSIFWGYRPNIASKTAGIRTFILGPLQLTPAQLALFDGSDPKLPIYLALNGTIYDVSASPKLYGPGGNYGFFAGKDATRAFVTGCFEEDLVGDLRGVEEMYIPVDEGEKSSHQDSREERREKKLRKEKETREARRKVCETVEGWRKLFDGGKGGKYFRVGKVVGQEWGAKRKLCKKAMEQRPKRKTEK